MGLKEKIQYKLILYKVNRAKKKGYGGIIEYYVLLPELFSTVKQKLWQNGIHVNEMDWGINFSWRSLKWNEDLKMAPPKYHIF